MSFFSDYFLGYLWDLEVLNRTLPIRIQSLGSETSILRVDDQLKVILTRI